MKITAQEEYGLRCLLRVAGAAGGHSLTLPEIAAAEGLSVPYAAKLLSVLRQAGLIESVRGRSGGYRLARSPREIGLGSLLLELGEPLFDEPGYCERHAGTPGGSSCVHHDACSLRPLWQTLEHWIRGTLDQITVADLLQSEGSIAELVRARLASPVFRAPLVSLNLESFQRSAFSDQPAASEPLTAES
ncbi:MAG: Rrf2 family transcriptional regulator [Gemmataceae bacterium]|nr:Rrf2 family transcriptional regulator [Gemmataceae bacterium]